MTLSHLYESDLGQPLLAFAFAFYIIAILWAEIRRKNPKVIMNLQGIDRRILVRGRACRLLTLGFTTIVLCFTLFPYVYNSFMPIRQLDLPVLNVIGLVLIATSLAWTVLAQLDFDEDLQRSIANTSGSHTLNIVMHSNKIVTGYFMMFLGITLSLANVVSTVLFIIACTVFYRNKQ